ncbi:type IV pilus biogenesis/stability protein PilW [Pseudomonas monteilii]|jgi:type IV pilus assembly protein PilF|uniref:type IV pilus biogenesis/stability protein PilW n=1 Tax=Pseudomonas alabamensis TaxID=3064349 RepID=UPI000745D47F|nr:type IV pilus biogenesis/stability protein PilW [Pseudomonas entomophila]AMA47092.1 pilus assembly protein PilW [Pseudomonas monteilii]
MTLRAALSMLSLSLLAGCVTSGAVDPLASREGRAQAGRASVQLGLGYLHQGRVQQAKVPLMRALALDPRDADAHAALALVAQAEEDDETARTHFRTALATRPHDARICNNFGSFLYARGEFAQAEQMFRQAASDTLYPERPQVYGNLGMTALKLGRRDEAQAYLRKAVTLDPHQPRALLALAELSLDEGDLEQARDYHERFKQVAEPGPRSQALERRLSRETDAGRQATASDRALNGLYPGTPDYQHYLSEQ